MLQKTGYKLRTLPKYQGIARKFGLAYKYSSKLFRYSTQCYLPSVFQPKVSVQECRPPRVPGTSHRISEF